MLLPYPKAALSRLAGRIARAPWSRMLIPAFVRHCRVDLDAAALPVRSYPTLQAFFCRELKPGLRPIDPAAAVVSPVDGVVGAQGVIADGQLFQAKGIRYSLADLLGDAEQARRFAGGLYCTLYLAPPDYHRVHAPIDGAVARARYIPGDHFPVNARAVRAVAGLFARNERLITYIEGTAFAVAVVKVGACLVGGIRVNYDLRWNAGPGPHLPAERRCDPPFPLRRGQELGRFEFGSTVILLIEPRAQATLCAAPGARIPMGAALARPAPQPCGG